MTDQPQTPLDRIFAELAARQLSQNEACRRAGIGRNVLSMAKTEGRLGLRSIEAFAKLFGVPVGVLLGEPPPSDAGVTSAAMGSEAADPSVRRLALDRLRPSPLNPRKSFVVADIAELADSIAESGGCWQNPGARLAPRPDDDPAALPIYDIVFGERRYRALLLLEAAGRLPPDLAAHGIPVKIIQATDAEHVAIAIIENLQRQDVNAIEEAEGFQQLQALDPLRWTNARIAERIGMSQRHVQLRLALASKLSPPIRERLRHNRLQLWAARLLTGVPPFRQEEILRRAGGNPTPESLRDAIGRLLDLVPTRLAIFERALYDSALYEDPDSCQIWFADKKRFIQLQAAALPALESNLLTRWSWVERVSWFEQARYSRGSETNQRGRKETGSVVVFNEKTGEVTIHENLRRAHVYTQTTPAHRERLDALREERRSAVAALCQAIGASLTLDDAVRLLLLRFITAEYGNSALRYAPAPRALFEEGEIFDPLAELAFSVGDNGAELKRGADPARVLDVLKRLDRAELGHGLVRSVAAQLDPGLKPHPALIELAIAYGIAVPPLVLMDDAEFDMELDRRMAAESEAA